MEHHQFQYSIYKSQFSIARLNRQKAILIVNDGEKSLTLIVMSYLLNDDEFVYIHTYIYINVTVV